MLDTFVSQDPPDDDAHPIAGTNLTPREAEILKLLAEGLGNKQIAPILSLSVRTVESHRNHIMHKMKFGSFSDLVKFAVQHRMVDCHISETVSELVESGSPRPFEKPRLVIGSSDSDKKRRSGDRP
jgi:DNA-binding CsgD family transcriptional regulator